MRGEKINGGRICGNHSGIVLRITTFACSAVSESSYRNRRERIFGKAYLGCLVFLTGGFHLGGSCRMGRHFVAARPQQGREPRRPRGHGEALQMAANCTNRHESEPLGIIQRSCFKAKARRRKVAKHNFLRVLATLRLCVDSLPPRHVTPDGSHRPQRFRSALRTHRVDVAAGGPFEAR